MPKAFHLSILLLTEDSGKEGYDTVHALTKELLRLIDAQAHIKKIDFEPLQNEQARLAMHATIWKSTAAGDYRKQVELVRAIATKLMEPNGFVFFHFDGDRPWKRRKDSENTTKFEKIIKTQVERLIGTRLNQSGVHGKEFSEQLSARMARLRPLTPYYSIESWLFQNTHEARRICHERYGGKDADRFDDWESDRGALDEVEQPKKQVCLRAAHNLELATQFYPAEVVSEVGKSFSTTVESLRACDALRQALTSTYADGQSPG